MYTKKSVDNKKRLLALIILILQSSSLVLLMRYTRTNYSNSDELYIPSTAVCLTELIKIIACIIIYYFNNHDGYNMITSTTLLLNKSKHKRILSQLKQDILQADDGIKLAIPAALYALQNNMLYIALSNLDAATYQVTYQLKVLSTAIFSVYMLKKRLNNTQWICLFMLMFGVALVQLDSIEHDHNDVDKITTKNNTFIGLLAVLCSCITSGFAGVYFEKVLKNSSTTLWIRNIQLGIFGFIFSFILMLINDLHQIQLKHNIFHGYNVLVLLVILCQALGGLLVAIVVRYTDQVIKGFALSIAVVLSCFFSIIFFDFQPTYKFIIGSILVLLSNYFYSQNKQAKNSYQMMKSSILPTTNRANILRTE